MNFPTDDLLRGSQLQTWKRLLEAPRWWELRKRFWRWISE